MTEPAHMDTGEERDPPYAPRADECTKCAAPKSTCNQTDIRVVSGTHLSQSAEIEPE